MLDDGTGNLKMPFEEQVHRTFGFIKDALTLENCTLADVVKCECWLTDPRDFRAFNAIYMDQWLQNPLPAIGDSGLIFVTKDNVDTILAATAGAQ